MRSWQRAVVGPAAPFQRRLFLTGPESITSLFTSPWGLMALLYKRGGGSSSNGGSALASPAQAPLSSQATSSTPPPPLPPPADEPSDAVTKAKRIGDKMLGTLGIEQPAGTPWYKNEMVVLAAVIMIMSALWDFVNNRKHRVQQLISEKCYLTLEVRTYQEEFDMILDWLSHQEIGKTTRNLTFKTFRHDIFDDDSSDMSDVRDDEWIRGEGAFAPGYGLHRVKYNGRTFYILRDIDGETNKGAVNGGGGRKGENAIAPNEVITVTVLARDRKVLEDWMVAVREHMMRERMKKVPIYVAARYGGWTKLVLRPKRPLDTLYLPSDAESTVQEVKNFFALKDFYHGLGVPWRRGYLLEGLPGTGKSSLIFAIAGELNLPVYLLNIRDARCGDGELISLVNSTPPRCLLVLEDLDTSISKKQWEQAKKYGVKAARERSWMGGSGGGDDGEEFVEPGASEVSISGLLNAIDGIAANEGRVMFITANHPEVFPDALLRPGRVDRRIHFDKMGVRELRDMFTKFAPPGTPPEQLLYEITGKRRFEDVAGTRSAADWQGKLLTRRLQTMPPA